MKVVQCTYEGHAGPILAILNETIVNSTALFDYEPRPAESMVRWFEEKRLRSAPVVGVEGDDGILRGFATWGTFRDWPAYRHTVETSVYVHADYRQCGVGRRLMQELIRLARAGSLHVLVAGIEATQQGSIRLHESLGFEHAGTIREAGFKFDRWLDLSFYQLVIR